MRWAFAVGAVLAMVFSTATGVVKAHHPPPTAVAEASVGGASSTDSLTVRPGDSVTFSAAGSAPGSGGSFDLTRWFFGYGTAQDYLDGTTVAYAFPKDGVYEVSLIVREAPSGKMDLDTVRVVVTSPDYGTEVPGAVILVSPTGPVNEDTPVTFDGRSSWPASYTGTKSYEWDFGDGGTSAADVVTHAYGYAGTYTIRLTVRDGHGHADTATTTVTVQNVAPQAAFALSPATPVMDSPAAFDASATADTATDLPALAYGWDFGDGQPGWGRTPSHTYNAPGTYTATLTVRDDNGLSSTATAQVPVANVLPVADAGSPVVVQEAETARFDGTGSSDTPSDAASLTYAWTDGAMLFGARPTNVWYDEASTKLDLVVTDPHGGASAVGSVPVTVQNRAPTASIVGASKSGSTVTIRGIVHEVGADSLTLTWAFGDGSPDAVQAFPNAAGTSPFRVWWNGTHNFPSGQGTYAVTLTADDGDGGTAVATAQVTSGGGIDNPAPTVTGLAADNPSKAEDAAFTFTPTITDGGEAVPPPPATPFLWDFGDGTTLTAGIGPVTHSYARAGTYTVLLKVTDGGGDSGANSRQVTVTNVAPTAAFTASSLSAVEDDEVVFDAAPSADTPSDDPALRYAWDLGDGTRTSGPTGSHRYRHLGTYTITLTVTDDNGEARTAPQTVTVANGNPAPAISVPVPGAERHATVLSALAPADSAADTPGLTYSWNLGDGGTATGARVAHEYAAQGTYTVTVTATDAHGGVGSATISLTVADTPPRVFAGPDQWFYGPAVPVPVPLHFHGVAEDDDGEALTYAWAFGDGATATGQDADHAYTVAGVYTATLTVTDASGAQAQDTLLVTVNLDSDGDQRSDAYEDANALIRTDPDSDGDGLLDYAEWDQGLYGTNPVSDDTDDDGLSDWEELFVGHDAYVTDPLDPDTDGDHLSDGLEVGVTVPWAQDTDTVNTWNGLVHGGVGYGPDQDPARTTNPLDTDSDHDGLPDGWVDCGTGRSRCVFSPQEEGYDPGTNPDPDGDDWDGVSGTEGNGQLDPNEYEDGNLNGGADSGGWNAGAGPGETDAALSDTDGDGLPDGLERGVPDLDFLPDRLQSGRPNRDMDPTTETDPLDRDTDDDGLWDGTEDASGDGTTWRRETDPRQRDSDGDGLTDGQERGLGWPEGYASDAEWQQDPTPHTASAGFRADGDIGATTTDPLRADTDGDGLPDGWADCGNGGRLCLTSPNEPGYVAGTQPDPDGDDGAGGTEGNGLMDPGEYEDSDLDGAPDVGETDPTNPDTDGDRLPDRYERLTTLTDPASSDSDGDGLTDDWEVRYGQAVDPNDPLDAALDWDGDTLSALAERALGTSPALPDTDGDWLPDGGLPGAVVDPDLGDHNWAPVAGSRLLAADARATATFPGVLGGPFDVLAAVDYAQAGIASGITLSDGAPPGDGNLAGAALLKFSVDPQGPGRTDLAVKVRYNPLNLPAGIHETYLQLYRHVGTTGAGVPVWALIIDSILGESSDGVPEADFVWAHLPFPGHLALADATRIDSDGDGRSDASELDLAHYDPAYRDFCGDQDPATQDCIPVVTTTVAGPASRILWLPADVTRASVEDVRSGTVSTLTLTATPTDPAEAEPEVVPTSPLWPQIRWKRNQDTEQVAGISQSFAWSAEGCVRRVEGLLRRDSTKTVTSVTLKLGFALGAAAVFDGYSWARTIPAAEIPADSGGGWVGLDVWWPNPPIPNAYCPSVGEALWITVHVEGDDGSVQWQSSSGDVYSGGSSWWEVDGSWEAKANDHAFRVLTREFVRDVTLNLKTYPADPTPELNLGGRLWTAPYTVLFNDALHAFLTEFTSDQADGVLYLPLELLASGGGTLTLDALSYETHAVRAASADVLGDDCDGDGLLDTLETDSSYGLSVNCFEPFRSRDSDRDGVLDGIEGWGYWFGDVPDMDGVINALDPDSDGDGLRDGWWEVDNADHGYNQLWDADEHPGEWNLGTNPWGEDTDGDGLWDGWRDTLQDFQRQVTEAKGEAGDGYAFSADGYGTDPLRDDTDGDGWEDGDEVLLYGSDPLFRDPEFDYWGLTWQVPLTGSEFTSEWISDGRIETRASDALIPDPADGTSQMELVWDHYTRLAHPKVLRAEVNIRRFDTDEIRRTESVNSVANLAIWAKEHDVGIVLNVNLGDGKEYKDGDESMYGRAAYAFVRQLATTLLAIDAEAYGHIWAYQVENELHHPWHHPGWPLLGGALKQQTLLHDGAQEIRRAEDEAGVDENGLPFRSLMVNYNFDWTLSMCSFPLLNPLLPLVSPYDCAYEDMKNYLAGAIKPGAADEAPIDAIGLDYYPGTWTTGTARGLRDLVARMTSDMGIGGTLGWNRKILVAETGMATCSQWCFANFPLRNTQVDQRNFYLDVTSELLEYYRTGGSAAGFLGVLWYWMADTTKGGSWGIADADDSALSPPEDSEWNFGLLEISEPGTWGKGAYNRGEAPKCALAWLADFDGNGLKPHGPAPGVDRSSCPTWAGP